MTITNNPNFSNSLSYDDVFIIPQYSEISSRKEVDISTNIVDLNLHNKPAGESKIEVPIMVANMDTVAGTEMALAVNKAGGSIALHRFQSIDDACKQYNEITNQINSSMHNIFVSVGVNRDSTQRAQTLYNNGARHMVIDIAHGHSLQMRKMIEWIKRHLPGTYVMAGNVGTAQGVEDLVFWGADAIKCNIGPGAACTTKNITGVTLPVFSCIQDCNLGKLRMQDKFGKPILLVADGGIREIGDICKAIGAGADMVMSGRLFAGCLEAPGKGIYRGSASSDVQTLYRTDKEYVPTPEGTSMNIELTNESATQVVEHIAGGLRSAYSYTGARNTKEFKEKVIFGIRHNKT